MFAGLFISGVKLDPLKKYWKKFLLLAIFGVIASQMGFVVGLTLTTPSHGALIYTLLPIFTAIFSLLLYRQKIHGSRQGWSKLRRFPV